MDADVHPLCRLHVHPMVVDHADLDGLYLQLLAVQTRLAGKHPSRRQRRGAHGHIGCHPLGPHQRIFRVPSGQLRNRLFQPRQPDETAQNDGVFLPGVCFAGLPDVRGHCLLAESGLGGGLRGSSLAGHESAGQRHQHPGCDLFFEHPGFLHDHAFPHGHPLLSVAEFHGHYPALLGKIRQHGLRKFPRGMDHVLHGDGLDCGNHLGALPVQADPDKLAAAHGGLFRDHRHCLGHALFPLFRAGADLGAGHPRHAPDQCAGLALAACRRDGGVLPRSGPVSQLLLQQLAAAFQPAGQRARSNRDHHCRGDPALYFLLQDIPRFPGDPEGIHA